MAGITSSRTPAEEAQWLRGFLLWFAVAGGPAAWAGHLGIGYLLASLPCVAHVGATRGWLYFVTVASAGIAGAAMGAGWYVYQRAGRTPQAERAESRRLSGFLASFGTQLAAISVAGILVQGGAIPVLAFCA